MQPSIAPWLSVADGSRALAFYATAFGAQERYRFEDSGRVVVARLAIGPAELWIQENPDAHGAAGPIRMILSVEDPDAVFAQALAAGGTEVFPVSDDHGWRIGRLADPFGHHWEVGRPLGG